MYNYYHNNIFIKLQFYLHFINNKFFYSHSKQPFKLSFHFDINFQIEL